MSNRKITEEEQVLFRDSIGEIRKIESDRAISSAPKPKAVARPHSLKVALDTDSAPDMAAIGERLAYSRPSTPRKTVNALRKGKITAQATLDLHGLTTRQAEHQLSDFMQQSLHDGLFSVHIIHGKGFGSEQNFPVLKNLVNHWLRKQHYVIAFCSAGHRDGGTGAVRVLIDKR